MLIGALSLLSGARADKSLIRAGAEACEIEAGFYFENAGPVNGILEAAELPACEDGQLLLRRVITRTGRMQKTIVNGALTTLANLQALGEYWIDFHGPHEPQSLFKEKRQLELLDGFARNQEILKRYQQGYRDWKEVLRQIESLRQQEQLSPEEIEFLQSQIALIESVELTEESIDNLERDFNRLTKAREIASLASRLASGLSSDSANGATARLSAILPEARKLGSMDEAAISLGDRLESIIIEADDIAAEFQEIAYGCDFDEQTAHDLNQKMNAWMEIQRKYGPGPEAVRAKRQQLEDKINRQGNIEGSIENLQKEADTKRQALLEIAEELRSTRVRAAAELGRETVRLVNRLGFRNAQFEIEVTREKDLLEHGHSACQFLFAANAGQDPMPLNKIASSGECARVMLALKATLAAADATPLLVFDEVDANIGGEIAQAVGEELEQLGQRHQVLCVTHLPQVASRARTHYRVVKDQSDDRATVAIAPVHDDRRERLGELARMLGDRHSETALRHAEEMLAPNPVKRASENP